MCAAAPTHNYHILEWEPESVATHPGHSRLTVYHTRLEVELNCRSSVKTRTLDKMQKKAAVTRPAPGYLIGAPLFGVTVHAR